MKENGKMESGKVMEFKNTKMEVNMKVIGEEIKVMERVN